MEDLILILLILFMLGSLFGVWGYLLYKIFSDGGDE